MRGYWRTISLPDGSLRAFVAEPIEDGFRAPILLLHDIYGLDHITRQYAATLATQGFIVFCPDLYWRIAPGIQLTDTYDHFRRALRLHDRFDVAKGIDDARKILATFPATTGLRQPTSVVGHGLGGRLAFLLSRLNEPISCVCYYGTGLEYETGIESGMQRPLIFHVGDADFVLNHTKREKLSAMFSTNTAAQFLVYAGVGHRFTSPASAAYNKAAADLADARTLEFLARMNSQSIPQNTFLVNNDPSHAGATRND